MGGLFGKHSKPKSRVTEQDRAVLQLKMQRDKLKQYQKKINLTLEKERELARQLLKDGKKDRAKLLLRKKKHQEQLLDRAENQLDNLEKLCHDLEFAQIEMKVLDGLKTGNEALKKVHEIMSIDDIEKIMDETREGIEKQREIDEFLTESLTEEDEEAVLAELEELTGVVEPPADIELNLPEVPSTEPREEKVKTQRTKVALAAS